MIYILLDVISNLEMIQVLTMEEVLLEGSTLYTNMPFCIRVIYIYVYLYICYGYAYIHIPLVGY